MNLYLLTQTANWGYDTYDACVVCAPSEEQAKSIHPRGDRHHVEGAGWVWSDYPNFLRCDAAGWASPDNVTATLIGVANPTVKAGVVLASFRAG